jgi:lipid-A-disaccharide synthase
MHPLKVFVIAGETSGDLLGGSILRALAVATGRPLQIMGIGGDSIKGAGMPMSIIPVHELAVMGIVEIIPKIPFFIKAINKTVKAIQDFKPDILLTIDSPDFCFRVQKKIRKTMPHRPRQAHVVAPSVWAWREGRAAKIAKFLDGLICLFPFEPPYFEKHNLRSVAIGHPAINAAIAWADPAPFRKILGLSEKDRVVGLYLGSRRGVIERHTDLFIQALNLLAIDHPDLVVVIPTFAEFADELRRRTEHLSLKHYVIADPLLKPLAMRGCNAALAVSGTVGLELAIANVPHIIGYKMNALTWWVLQRMAKTTYAHLVNIGLQKLLVPECLQENCTAAKLAEQLRILIDQPAEQARQQIGFSEFRKLIGEGDADRPADKAAYFLRSMIP